MTKHTLWLQILAVALVTMTAAIALPQATFSADKFEYKLVPFHEKNFDSQREFEEWLDDLGAKGWVSIFHFAAGTNPKDHQRLFMRRIGGQSLVVDYEIEEVKRSPPERVNMVEVRFGKATIFTKPKKWKKMINKEAKKGYIISDFQLSDNTGTKFTVVFAGSRSMASSRNASASSSPFRPFHSPISTRWCSA